MSRTTHVANAERAGRWWLVTVPTAPGAFSQVHRLDEVADAAREAIAFVLDVDPDSFDVEVRPALPAELLARVERARELVAALEGQQRVAAAASREAARALVAIGLTRQDSATVLGVSQQRVSQLVP